MTSPNYTAQTPDILVNLVTDSIPPETSITSPASGTYGPDITFEFTATDDYTQAGEFGFYWWLEPLESKPSEPSGEASAPYAGLSAGNYTFKVAAIDRGLNEDPTPASVAPVAQLDLPVRRRVGCLWRHSGSTVRPENKGLRPAC